MCCNMDRVIYREREGSCAGCNTETLSDTAYCMLSCCYTVFPRDDHGHKQKTEIPIDNAWNLQKVVIHRIIFTDHGDTAASVVKIR